MLELTGTGLAARDVIAVARDRTEVRLAPAARDAMQASAAVVERLGDRVEPAYGVSTGFGSPADVPTPGGRATNCSARSCARTRPAWASRSSPRSCAR